MQTEDQSLEDVLGASMDKLEAGEPLSVSESPELEIDQPQGEVEAVETPPSDEDPQKEPEPEAAAEPDPEEPVQEEVEPAPSSWRKDVAAKWGELPADIRAEINRRESEYHKGIEQYKPAVQFAQEMNAAITPYVRNIQAAGVAPAQAMNHLLMIEDKLRNGDEQAKLQTLVKIASDYGIDIQKATQTQPDPRMWQMEQQLAQERATRAQYERSIADRDNQAVTSEIEAFASAPGHEHFEAVKADMAAMLQSGMAQGLQDAYDKAVWARPDLRQSLIEKERTEAEQRALEQARRNKAKSAAIGVKGSPPSSSGALKSNASIEDVVAAAMDGTIS